MKKIILFTVAFFSFATTFSQTHFYTAFGYNLGYAKLEGLNVYGVDRYNATRTPPVDTSWTTFDEMDNFHFPNGFCASMGGSSNRIMMDVTWVGRHMNRTAGGTKPGYEGRREMKWRLNTFNIGFGVALGKNRGSRFNLGLSFDFGSEKVFTRLNENGVYKTEDYDLLQKNMIIGSTFFMQIILSSQNIPGGIFIRPYIQLPYFKTNYYDTHEELDANNPIEYDAAESNSWNAGVQLMIGLVVKKSD